MRNQIRVGLVGYGEIGSTLGEGLRANGLVEVLSYDNGAFDGPYAALIQQRAAAAGVTLVDSPAALVARVDIILGVTPGSSSIASATAFAPHLTKGKIYADVASATPKVKQAVEKILAGTGALLADASIMGTPKDGLALPILSSGPAARAVAEALTPWGMRIDPVEGPLGTASGIKIMRSVLIKGIEALLDEMLLGARYYGLADTVMASAAKTLQKPLDELAAGMITTGVIHAKRRAEEVAMAAEALADAGVEPLVTRGTEARLRWVESLDLKTHFEGKVPEDLETALKAIEQKSK
ncbi:NAD(P)-dependent oxidoreductase [Roseomonas sp. 18066]|uniref:NAD(P)-dependent oxidoreductase n=1 Tax=Roseomonas sp. 18066 TaxID=2681412 RepID=UPI001357EB31|nr:NAD(P)-dependent oxidoreductase [Roseomonas sp. 18066]